MSSENFYKELNRFSGFSGITDTNNFSTIPGDWKVIITDIKGSTKAIEEGRYKDVNTIGAAAIVSAQKGMDGEEFPFVFGGDGATLVVPPSKVENVITRLLGLRKLSEQQFNLGLRVGVVDVSELLEEGAVLEVAKFELHAGKCIAIFKGGGLNFAEAKIKGQEEKYAAKDQEVDFADLSGLSCRWNPIPNRNGKILSFLVESRGENSGEIYNKVLVKLDEIFKGQIEEANPVNTDLADYKSIRECFENEKRYHGSLLSIKLLFRFLEIIAAVLIFKFKIPPLVFNPKKYSAAMRTHSDYRKFDDMLRMIIDCTEDQVKEINTYLETQYKEGKLFYGLHESENSLMTCYVDDLNDGNHIHFIDGGSGGYAMAAKQMKAQIKEASN
ncbi:MAG: hypothetical protein ACJAT2_002159 [Bacteriovoracaceae bacterium]|jgi:hypothetical protein